MKLVLVYLVTKYEVKYHGDSQRRPPETAHDFATMLNLATQTPFVSGEESVLKEERKSLEPGVAAPVPSRHAEMCLMYAGLQPTQPEPGQAPTSEVVKGVSPQ